MAASLTLRIILTGARRVSCSLLGHTWHCRLNWDLFRCKANSSIPKRVLEEWMFSFDESYILLPLLKYYIVQKYQGHVLIRWVMIPHWINLKVYMHAIMLM